MKPENLRRWTIHIKHLSDVPVSRNWYETVSKYTKIQAYTILCKSRFKQIKFSKYATKNQKRVYPTGAWVFLNFYFAFSINIIENIISSSPYSPHNVTRTLANDRAAYWSRDTFISLIRYSASSWPNNSTAISNWIRNILLLTTIVFFLQNSALSP